MYVVTMQNYWQCNAYFIKTLKSYSIANLFLISRQDHLLFETLIVFFVALAATFAAMECGEVGSLSKLSWRRPASKAVVYGSSRVLNMKRHMQHVISCVHLWPEVILKSPKLLNLLNVRLNMTTNKTRIIILHQILTMHTTYCIMPGCYGVQ